MCLFFKQSEKSLLLSKVNGDEKILFADLSTSLVDRFLLDFSRFNKAAGPGIA